VRSNNPPPYQTAKSEELSMRGIQIRTQNGTVQIGFIVSLIGVLAGLSSIGNFVMNFINFGEKFHWWSALSRLLWG
jgi:hypothetical protein